MNNYKSKSALALIVCVLEVLGCGIQYLSAQTFSYQQIGIPQNSGIMSIHQSSGSYDPSISVNVANGNLHVEIPIVSYPQRGKMHLQYELVYDSASAWTVPTGTGAYSLPNYQWSLTENTGAWGSRVLDPTNEVQNQCYPPNYGIQGTYPSYGPFTYSDPSGASHIFYAFTDNTSGCTLGPAPTDAPSAQAYANDGSGYFLSVTNYNQVHIYAPDGTLVLSPDRAPGSDSYLLIEDTNGNYLAGSVAGGDAAEIFDTAGRSLPAPYISGGWDGALVGVGSFSTNPYTLNLPTAAGTAPLIVHYSVIPVCPSFSPSFCNGGKGTMVQISGLTLPDQRSYTFTYDQGTTSSHLGVLKSITTPEGGQFNFTFQLGPPNLGQPIRLSQVVAGPSEYDLSYTATTTTINSAPVRTTSTKVTGPARTDAISNTTLRDDTVWLTTLGNGAMLNKTTYSGPSTAGNVLQKVAIDYYDVLFSQVNHVVTTLGTNGPSATEQYTYIPPITLTAANGLSTSYPINIILSRSEWDFGVATSSTATRKTALAYNQSTSAFGARILNQINSVKLYDNGSQIAETDYVYDGATISSQSGYQGNAVAGAPGHDDQAYSSSIRAGRNNVTTTKMMVSTGSFVSTSKAFNMLGEVISATDGNTHTTYFDYTDCYAESQSNPSCTNHSSFVNNTYVKNALNQVSSSSFNYSDGSLQSERDPNDISAGRQGQYYNYDLIQRPVDSFSADGGQTHTDYGGTILPQIVTTTVYASPNPNIVSSVTFDGYGRPVTSTENGNIVTDLTYDAIGGLHSMSNPHTSSVNATDGTITYAYDALGRKTLETQQDGSTQKWSYSGNTTTSTDENLNQWQRTNDALGRLTKVLEPNGTGTAATMETDYTYDALDNLRTVTQWGGASGASGARTRTFTYDSLSRLLAANNPENRNTSGAATQTCAGATGTWTNCYTYDANGNVVSKSDNRGVTTSYSYDSLNRVLTKTYNDGVTSSVTNIYDSFTAWGQPRTNTIGRLASTATCGTNLSISGGSCNDETYSYDAVGRINHIEGATPSQAGHAGYWVQPQYDLAGDMTSLTYPDGRVVNQTWNSAGQLAQVADSNGYQYMTSQSTYWPNGAPQAIWYGNGVANGYHMNNRLQVDEIGNIRTGTSAPGGYSGGTSLTTKHYCFGPATPPLSSTIAACPALASANNGNIWQAQDSLNSARTQNFTFDTLNRIKTFATANNSAAQTYTIDAWGNLSQSGTLSSLLTFDTNNKIASGGVGYDAAGNEIAINNGVSTVNYTYDADGHVLTAANGSAKYFYSSEGDRVRKDMGSTNWTEYIYFGGQPLTELSSDGTWSDYIYDNGQRLARADKYDIRLHLSGTNCSNCGANPNMFTGTTSLTAANGYTVRNGDVLSWRQYQNGSTTGGLYLFFTDGTDGLAARDADGQLIDQDQTMNTWHMRTVDLSAYAGKTIELVDPFQWTSAPAGSWNIYYGDITLTSTDGSAIPIYSRTMMALSLNTNPSVSNAQAITEKVADTNPITTTTFYHGDQIGSARLMTASGGWPVWSDTFYPFGQETSATSAINHYKFTGKERDTESGNDYFGARYYASSMGRFMSPDPSQLTYADQTNPQSLNLYSYVRNNPLINTDPTGMECVWDDGSYDDQHDPDTGNDVDANGKDISGSGYSKCSAAGGSWVDHSFFQNANNNGANLPDWSPDANSSTAATAPLGLVNLVSGCTGTILSALNSATKGQGFTSADVTDNFYWGGAVNIDVTANNLSAAQYGAVQQTRYSPPGFFGGVLGIGPSVHLPKGPGNGSPSQDSPSTLPFSKQNGTVTTSVHIDSAQSNAAHPIGAAIHGSVDVAGAATRNPCP